MITELLDSSLFSDTHIDVLDEITSFCQYKECDDGDLLIEENSSGSFDIFILCSGDVEIFSNSSESTSSEVVISSQENDLLGEISWLLRGNRTASVRCIKEATVIQIDGDQLMNYFEQHRESGYHFMKRIAILLAQRMSKTDGLLKQLLWNV
ncbi:MAG: cyclic nucleotide-binding domain-containing protein [Gammaproteobacteria bacterium]|nr:cyclic nucleotide-binding domain-containing protein [Gammaproteobacteria bacterium]